MIKVKDQDKYLKYSNFNLILSDYEYDNYESNFYLELQEDEFIENNAEYTSDGKFIKSITASILNKTNYNCDSTKGLINSVVNCKGVVTNYTYDNKDRIVRIQSGNKELNYTYNNKNKLSQISQGTKQYNLIYDEFLNLKQIKIVNNVTLVTNTYENNNGNLISTTYGNNHNRSYTYDEFNRIKSIITMNDNFNYKYNSNGNLVKILSNNDIYKYTYDLSKRLREYRFNDFRIKYSYDNNDNLLITKYSLGNISHEIINYYDADDALIKTVLENDEINYNYDELGRINDRYRTGISERYEYVTNGKKSSLLIKKCGIFSYKYDKLNNITHIYEGNVLTHRYYYDQYNQLIKEHNYILNATTKYKYDNSGNILYKFICKLNTDDIIEQHKYIYNNSNWEDQLTYYDDKSITYDEIGNPLTIGSDMTLSWINGRQLNSYIDLNNNITYKYNKDGIRIKKVVNNVETEYYVEGSKIVLEKTGNNVLYYVRNSVDGLIGFYYNNDYYYYLKNNQNDIVGICASDSTVVALYEYDSWGNIISITNENGTDISYIDNHIANINPFRYRGYYYDKETKLYYLSNRYYNPEWGRFINADGIIGSNGDLLGYNLFSYCSNNPIMNIDSNGMSVAKIVLDTAKKMKKSIVDTVEKISCTVYTRSTTSSGNNKKVVKKSNTPKVCTTDINNNESKLERKKVSGHFVSEIGTGHGFAFDVNEIVSIGDYSDFNYKFNNTCSTISEKSIVILGFGYKEVVEQDASCDDHSPLSSAKKSSIISIGTFEINDGETSLFLGLDFNFHFIAGLHIKLGYEIDW